MQEDHQLPDFLIIGAEKAGTTWLYHQLRSHDQIFMADTKEVHFFNKWDSRLHLRDNYVKRGIDWYKEFFRGASAGQKIGEVTPLYLCDAEAPERIAHTLPAAKVIAILRDPATRAYSHYWMARRRGHERRSFEEVLEAKDPAILKRGFYGAQISRWLTHMNKEALLVLLYEDVIADPSATLVKIAKFLEVDAGGFDEQPSGRVHGARHFRFAWAQDMAIGIARFLRESRTLAPLARGLKRSGLYGAFRKLNETEEDYPPLNPELRQDLDKFYAGDKILLIERTGLNLDSWQQTPTS